MSPIEALKLGIETGDWSKITWAYKTLTGQELDAPTHDLGPKQLATRFRDRVHAAVDAVFGELVIGTKPEPARKAKASVIVVPTAEETEAVLKADKAGDQIEMLPEDGLGFVEPDPDPIRHEDINGEGPTEPLKTAGQSAKPTCYSEPMKFVTRDGPLNPQEVRRNQMRAQRAATRKKTRPEPTKYVVECTGCGRTFESLRKPSHGIGQKCSRCIRNMEKPEK